MTNTVRQSEFYARAKTVHSTPEGTSTITTSTKVTQTETVSTEPPAQRRRRNPRERLVPQ
jgi:hypothetical protein